MKMSCVEPPRILPQLTGFRGGHSNAACMLNLVGNQAPVWPNWWGLENGKITVCGLGVLDAQAIAGWVPTLGEMGGLFAQR